MALRRERERRVVLTEAVAQMRRRGKPECEMADLFMDFKGIQVTLAVMAQALIDGRIDCKTAGRLAVELQMMSKLLWLYHKKTKTLPRINTDNADLKEPAEEPKFTAEARRRGEEPGLPQIYADKRGSSIEKASTIKDTKEHEGRKTLPRINTDNADLKKRAKTETTSLTTEARRRGKQPKAGENWAANEREETRIALAAEVLAFGDSHGCRDGPREMARAA
jgi:hypothetical protein